MSSDQHGDLIRQQFTAQAEAFAQSQTLHADAALAMLVEAAAPQAGDVMLDVACGPGSVVAAFAPHVREAIGLDTTEAMLDRARTLAADRKICNASWRRGDAYGLPFADASLDIVTCRFAVHHFERPDVALAEMLRVLKPGGRIVVCDGLASDDPAKAAAHNAFERMRDPSTIGFKTRNELTALFVRAGLTPAARFYKLPGKLSTLLKNSFPPDGDLARLRDVIEQSVEGDKLGLNAHREGGDVSLETPVAILSAVKR